MPVCPRQCHLCCVLVGIEHGVHEREARVALDVVAWLRSLAVLARFRQFVSTVVVRQCCVLSGLMALCVRRNAQGGAIYASSSSSINIQHTTFVGNQAVCSWLLSTYGMRVPKVLRWSLVKGLLWAAAMMCLVAAKRATSA